MAVTTMRASLDPSAQAAAISSPCSTAGVRMTTSALRPWVSSGSMNCASRMRGHAVGGADLLGLLQLEGHRVDGDDGPRTGDARPWMAPDPTPPHPMTTTVSPGLTLARSTAEPKPVEMPQLMSAAAFMLA